MVKLSGSGGTLVLIYPGALAVVEQAFAAEGTLPQSAIIVEPDPELAAALRTRFSNTPEVFVHSCALGPADGMAVLRVYNAPGLRSIAPPLPALLSLLPGLKQIGQLSAQTMPISNLLAQLDSLPRPRRLVMNGLGLDASVYKDLQSATLIQKFDTVALHCGAEVFFENAPDAEQITKILLEAGHRLDMTDDDDPDMPDLYFSFDPAAKADTDIMAKIESAQREQEAARTALSAQTQKIAELEANTAAQSAALTQTEEQLRAAKDALEQKDRRIRDLEETEQAHLAALSALQAELETAKHDTDAYRKSLAAAHQSAGASEADMNKDRDAHHQARIADLEQRLTLARNELRRAEGQIEIIKDLFLREISL